MRISFPPSTSISRNGLLSHRLSAVGTTKNGPSEYLSFCSSASSETSNSTISVRKSVGLGRPPEYSGVANTSQRAFESARSKFTIVRSLCASVDTRASRISQPSTSISAANPPANCRYFIDTRVHPSVDVLCPIGRNIVHSILLARSSSVIY